MHDQEKKETIYQKIKKDPKKLGKKIAKTSSIFSAIGIVAYVLYAYLFCKSL